MQSIEVQIKNWIEWYESDANNIPCNPIIRQMARASMEMFKDAPRERPQLISAIALKKQAWQNENEYPARSILYAELDALERILTLIG